MATVSGNVPPEVLTVQPTNIATFYATRWQGDEDDSDIKWMAKQFGWKIKGVGSLVLRHQTVPALLLVGKSGHPYKVGHGSWVVALGVNGSLRVVTDRQFRTDYKEIAR